MISAVKVLSMAALVAAMPLFAPASPANAGSIGFTVSPKGEDAEALRSGLALYSTVRSLRKHKKNRAKIEQYGEGNGAAISQRGENNWANVFQRGRGNTGTISQNGDDNAFALVQLGKRNSSQVTQNGNGNAGIRFEWGW
ncbi:MAG: curlin [Hyphomicrobium sp.]|nr:curlin [Hyphomicrobium sp.]